MLLAVGGNNRDKPITLIARECNLIDRSRHSKQFYSTFAIHLCIVDGQKYSNYRTRHFYDYN